MTREILARLIWQSAPQDESEATFWHRKFDESCKDRVDLRAKLIAAQATIEAAYDLVSRDAFPSRDDALVERLEELLGVTG